MLPPLENVETDGRRARAVRTKAAIVTALLDLVREGSLAPTAKEIALRAGVAIRSIGQHFPSREKLFAYAAAEHARRAKSARARPIVIAADLETKIAEFVEARATELEETSAIRRAASAITRSPTVAKAMSLAAGERRRHVANVFAAEISGDELTLHALDVATGGRAWDQMRIELKLSIANAKKVMTKTVSALTQPR